MFVLFEDRVHPVEDGGQESSRNGVPDAGDGADDRRVRHSREMLAGQNGGHAGVLHADFDGDGAVLGFGEPHSHADQVSCDVAQGIVQKDRQHDEPAGIQESLAVFGGHAAHDEGQADDGHGGHDADR